MVFAEDSAPQIVSLAAAVAPPSDMSPPMMISNGFLEPYHEHNSVKRNLQGTTPVPPGKRDEASPEDESIES